MQCLICKGKIAQTTRIITRKTGKKKISIKNVPAEVCSGCGDMSTDDLDMRTVEEIVEAAKNSPTDFVIADFNDYIYQSGGLIKKASAKQDII